MTTSDRARIALKMRLRGSTYREIAERFRFNTQRAYQVVQWIIEALLDPLNPPDNPEDQYLADAIADSPYLSTKGKIIFLDNNLED